MNYGFEDCKECPYEQCNDVCLGKQMDKQFRENNPELYKLNYPEED